MSKRTVLEAFGHAVSREVTVAPKVPERLLWQQLYNRLQWNGEAAQLLESERERRSRAGGEVWLRFGAEVRESPSLYGTIPWHLGPVRTCAISPDGDFFVSAGGSDRDGDYSVRVWDARLWQLRFAMDGHEDPVHACVVGPDGSYVATIDRYKRGGSFLRIWDPRTGDQTSYAHHPHRLTRLSASPDGDFLVAVDDAGNALVWGTGTWEAPRSLEHGRPLLCCAVSPDGNMLATGSASVDDAPGSITIWETSSWGVQRTLTGAGGPITSIVFSPDGSVLVAATNGHIRVWSTRSSDMLGTFEGSAESLAFSPDGSFVVSCDLDRRLRVWDAETWEVRSQLEGHDDDVTACCVSPDVSYVLSASLDHTLKIWDVSRALVAADSSQRPQPEAVLADAANVAVPSSFEPNDLESAGTVRVEPRGRKVTVVTGHWADRRELELVGHTGPVNDWAVSPDGSYIVTASHDGTLRIWSLSTGDQIHMLTGHGVVAARGRYSIREILGGLVAGVLHCAVSPDGSFIVSGGADGTLRIWDPRRGKEYGVVYADPCQVTGCAVTPDGQYVVSTRDDRLLTVHELSTNRAEGARSVALLPGPDNVVVHRSRPLFGTVSSRGFASVEAVCLSYSPLVALPGPETSVRCPACSEIAAEVDARPGSQIECPSCGASLRVADLERFRPRKPLLRRLRRLRRRAEREASTSEAGPLGHMKEWAGYSEPVEPHVPWRQRLSFKLGRGRMPWIPGAYIEIGREGRTRSEIARRWLTAAIAIAAAVCGYLVTRAPAVALLSSVVAIYVIGVAVPEIRSHPKKVARTLYSLLVPASILGVPVALHGWWGNWWLAVPAGIVLGFLLGIVLQAMSLGMVKEELDEG